MPQPTDLPAVDPHIVIRLDRDEDPFGAYLYDDENPEGRPLNERQPALLAWARRLVTQADAGQIPADITREAAKASDRQGRLDNANRIRASLRLLADDARNHA